MAREHCRLTSVLVLHIAEVESGVRPRDFMLFYFLCFARATLGHPLIHFSPILPILAALTTVAWTESYSYSKLCRPI